MTSKIAKAAMVSAHTAGIFADMTVDGPVIGDLVVAIDRAKNLPNRKTMGKQDPYCAARLGKEAQKTSTDKRGGQTPKWDHEMRFTVHDSPDYYKLKVSVFNDDKKTDLIGETWVALDSIVIRGGGEQEGWHNLSYKGRYAGEIWIELTFWDTRPREEKAVESPSSSTISLRHERSVEAVGGPRGPKPTKRRPLPADPTSAGSSPLRPSLPEHTQSSPLPYTPPSGSSRLHGPSTSPAGASGRHSQPAAGPSPAYASSSLPKSYSQPQLDHYDDSNFHPQDDYRTNGYAGYDDEYVPSYNGQELQNHDVLRNQFHQEPQYGGLDLPELPPHTPRNSRSTAQQSPKFYGHQTPDSSPSYQLPNYGPSTDVSSRFDCQNGNSLTTRSSMNNPPSESHSRQKSFDDYTRNASYPSIEDDDAPPPPPVHRSSGVGLGSREASPAQQYIPPLKCDGSRGSFSNGQLAQNYGDMPNQTYMPPSPETSQSAPRANNYDPYEQPRIHSQRDPELHFSTPTYGQKTPQKYQAYSPEAGRQDERHDHRPSMGSQTYGTPPYRGRPQAADTRYGSPMDTGDERSNGQHDDSRVHHSSVPIIKPRAVSPNTSNRCTTMRKSVSPRPAPTAPEDGLSGVPFSPDSFDQLNPNLKSAQSINTPGPKYNTPEGAREAARQREREDEIAKGPIIDHNGKVVDPSDYLPTDTWAPELQRKVARPSHEIKLRFKHSPGGAQPMQASVPRAPREPAIQPHSIVTTPVPVSHSYSTEEISPTSSRNRLQKKSRAHPGSYNSSPILPTMHQQTPAASYPLREHPNYGYNSSPNYHRGSPCGLPPPIPAKIPLGRGQEDWNDRLSEELRDIDLGVGSGGRRRGAGSSPMGTSRYGG